MLRGVAADCGNCQDKSRQQPPFKNHALHADYCTPRGKRVPLAVGNGPNIQLTLASYPGVYQQLPMGQGWHVDAVYPPVAIARHTGDDEF